MRTVEIRRLAMTEKRGRKAGACSRAARRRRGQREQFHLCSGSLLLLRPPTVYSLPRRRRLRSLDMANQMANAMPEFLDINVMDEGAALTMPTLLALSQTLSHHPPFLTSVEENRIGLTPASILRPAETPASSRRRMTAAFLPSSLLTTANGWIATDRPTEEGAHRSHFQGEF